MGSSNVADIKAIDASVGGLVWVRRRNGSWWPGRILGLNELSEGCLVSPKSGVPVMLLGRQDSSIDWYNLEKSKRVKAFRCGEYNECIEKAKAAAANLGKKVVKYMRREDAILHALELESMCLGGQNCLNFGYKKDISGGELEISARDSSSISNSEEADDEMAADAGNSSELALELSQSCSSFEESAYVNSCKVQSRRTPNDSEDDGTEGAQRMRELEDLSPSGVSNGKVHYEGQLELVRQDEALPDNSSTGNVSYGKILNGSKVSSLSMKRKRSQVPIVHEFSKRKFQRRTLMKVLESTSMVSVPVIWGELPKLCCSPLSKNELKESASIEMNITGVSRDNGVSLNDDEADNDLSGRLFDVPFVGEDDHSVVSCTSVKSVMGFSRRQSSRSIQAEDEHLRTEEMDESDSTSVGGARRTNLNRSMEKGSSKWQSKRKRNSRQMSGKRRQVDLDDESSIVAEEETEDRPCSRRQETKANLSAEGSKRLLPRQSTMGLDRNIDDSSLFDVKLEVRASYKPQHVPLVSLMSKLNGKAIVGHPLTVEILEDGHFNSFFSRAESTTMEGDENSLLFPGKSTKTKGQLTKKTRKLSTLTGCKQNGDDQKSILERPRGRNVDCIPLKVVFGRISEAVDGRIRPISR